jgi:hypothetical protein
MKLYRLAFISVLLAASACASSSPPPLTIPATQTAVCAPGVSLGKVTVAPLTRWRADQKEPELREAIAMKAINTAFAGTPCAAGAGR